MFERTLETLKTLFLWVTFPVWVPVVALLLFTELAFVPAERRLRRQLRKAGRTATFEVLNRGGTLIYDFPTFNWGISRLWWTPDDVAALAPISHPTPEEANKGLNLRYRWHPYHRWVWENYLESPRGTALLISTGHPYSRLDRMRERYPQCKIMTSFSGGRAWESHCRLIEAIEADCVLEDDDGTKAKYY